PPPSKHSRNSLETHATEMAEHRDRRRPHPRSSNAALGSVTRWIETLDEFISLITPQVGQAAKPRHPLYQACLRYSASEPANASRAPLVSDGIVRRDALRWVPCPAFASR